MSHPPKRSWLALSIRASEHRATAQHQERDMAMSKAQAAQQALSLAQTRSHELLGAWTHYRDSARFAVPLDAAYRHYAEHLHRQAQDHHIEAQRLDQAVTDSEIVLRQTVAQGRALNAVSSKLLAVETTANLRRSLRQDSEDWAARVDGQFLGGELP